MAKINLAAGYLIARPEAPAENLLRLLGAAGIPGQILPLMAIDENPSLQPRLKLELSQTDALLVTSPLAVISLAAEINQLNEVCRLFAVGQSSAQKLAELSGRAVMAPRQFSGIQGLINEEVLLPALYRQLLVVGGNEINPQLAAYLQQQQINYGYLNTYQRRNNGLLNLAQVEKLVNDPTIVGIIITSKLLAEYLLECERKLSGRIARIFKLDIISSHPQISAFLQTQGFKRVYETTQSSNAAIVKLIREIEYERNYQH